VKVKVPLKLLSETSVSRTPRRRAPKRMVCLPRVCVV
jgi:hypothetical protein